MQQVTVKDLIDGDIIRDLIQPTCWELLSNPVYDPFRHHYIFDVCEVGTIERIQVQAVKDEPVYLIERRSSRDRGHACIGVNIGFHTITMACKICGRDM